MITLMIWTVGMQQRCGYSHRGTVSRREGCDEGAVTPAGSVITALLYLHCLSKSGCLRPFRRFKHWPHLHILSSSSSSSSERCARVVKVALNMEIGDKKWRVAGDTGRGFMGTVMHTVVHNTHTQDKYHDGGRIVMRLCCCDLLDSGSVEQDQQCRCDATLPPSVQKQE